MRQPDIALIEEIQSIFPQTGDIPETQSVEALDAAVNAYDHGRGMWPTLSVAERIEHMAQFVFRMIEAKDRVVGFLMWEVGKSLQDSEKENDRTIQYINDTLAALKDLDRISSGSPSRRGSSARSGVLLSVSCCAWDRSIIRSTRSSQRSYRGFSWATA